MNGFVFYTYLFIKFYVISSALTQESTPSTQKGPGKSGCHCWAELQQGCNTSEVPVQHFPEECTSFLYDGVRVGIDYKIFDEVAIKSGIDGYLDKLIATGNKVIIYYGHYTQMEWTQVLGCNTCTGGINAKDEMQSLKSYLDQHKGITGIVIVNLDISGFSSDFPQYTENLKIYINVMKSTFPDLDVGLQIVARKTLDYYNNPTINEWLDFKVLDPSIDFYVLSLKDFNECSDDFIKTGVYPLTGNNNSLEIIRRYLEDAGIPMSKLYFKFVASGTLKHPTVVSCPAFYPFICSANSKGYNDTELCADTQQSLFDKGKYARENGAGFITSSIDVDDTYGCCQCGRSFPAFYALLDGYNGAPEPRSCLLFDRS